eukprot:GDKI01031431.1.p1 GENE.GDKI01031431.1~~GDKI01031431.1.p1  ORF type:complete len:368 (-),score=104.02 GDKI01031431.1:163-1266(-)
MSRLHLLGAVALLSACLFSTVSSQSLRATAETSLALRSADGDGDGPVYHELYTDDVSIGTCGFGLDGTELSKGNFAYVFEVPARALHNSYLKQHASVYSDVKKYTCPEKQYVVKVNTEDGAAGKNEFAMQKIAGIAPGVVAGWECSGRDEHETTAAIVMERMAVSVETLLQKIEKKLLVEKTLTVEQAVPLLAMVQRGILGVLERLAQVGVTHGDEFVGNFMLDFTGRVRAIDFGMSKTVPFVGATAADALRQLTQSVVVSHFLDKAAFLEQAGLDITALKDTADPHDDTQLLLSAHALLGAKGEPHQWGRFAPYIGAAVAGRQLLMEVVGQEMTGAPEQGGVPGDGTPPPLSSSRDGHGGAHMLYE